MPQFRKKPAVIEAVQWFTWMGLNHPGVLLDAERSVLKGSPYFVITAHSQAAYLEDGDWIIPEMDRPDRYYPCKPDIFAATYEPVTNGASEIDKDKIIRLVKAFFPLICEPFSEAYADAFNDLSEALGPIDDPDEQAMAAVVENEIATTLEQRVSDPTAEEMRVAKAIADAGNAHVTDGDLSAVYMAGSDYMIDCVKLAKAAIAAKDRGAKLTDEEMELVIDALNGRRYQLENMAEEPHRLANADREEYCKTADEMRQLYDRLIAARGQHVQDSD